MNNYFKNPQVFTKEFVERVELKYLVNFNDSTAYQRYTVLGEMLKEHIQKDWLATNNYIKEKKLRQVYYFSMEFLLGRMITNNLMNAGVRGVVEKAFTALNIDINEVEEVESDAGLGNGGLGRLAACFMDSVASINIPVHGNCLRYSKGFFTQDMVDKQQVEYPDAWLKDGYVWETRKDSEAVEIPFYGTLKKGKLVDPEVILAVPYDLPVIGSDNNVVNTLRLWKAEPLKYPAGKSAYDYENEVAEITNCLYPPDDEIEGKYLRLKQQYLFSRAGCINAIRHHKAIHGKMDNFHKYNVFQINDTHPAIVVAELTRYLMDEEGFEFAKAFEITSKTCAYTNHTIMAEALERWDVELIKTLLPRVYEVIVLINKHFTAEVLAKTNDKKLVKKLEIISNKQVKMAHLSIVGSYSVNGVAELHTKILKDVEMKDFHEYYPGKFNNKTNGITHRRWLLHINPKLVEVLNKKAKGWQKDTSLLDKLSASVNDAAVLKQIKDMKYDRKVNLAKRILKSNNVVVDPNSIFDIQVKRLHEYKRQLMNALHIMYVYNRLKTDPEFKANYHPHTFIFGGKSAPTYRLAKKIIRLINTIADKVNNDKDTNHLLKAVYVVNYNVTYAEAIMTAADVSEQISTASKEASGTGNMKFMMNGALTLGTLDGANVEIKDFVGEENAFIFGMDADEVNALYKKGNYNPKELYESDPRIKTVLDNLVNGYFDGIDQEFEEIFWTLTTHDNYFVLKDFAAYIDAHEAINTAYKDDKKWLQMSLLNIAKSGFFSTDRTMEEYNDDIWHLKKYDFSK